MHASAGVRSKHRDPGLVVNGPNKSPEEINSFGKDCATPPKGPRNGSLREGNKHNSRSTLPARKSADKVSPAQRQISYPRWYGSLVSEVLKSRTPFAAFLNSTITASKLGRVGPLAPTFFPIPLPRQGAFDRMPAHPSASKRRRHNLSRAVHVVVMAFNFWYHGGRHVSEELLQREPNKQHLCLFLRIKALIRSDGPALSLNVEKAGRRFPELTARLSELSNLLTIQGCTSSPYDKSFAGVELPKDNSQAPELEPYSNLDADRLKTVGTGHWDATRYLSDPLILPYKDPSILEHGKATSVLVPIRDSVEEVAKLARKWDERGLLWCHKRPVPETGLTRIFNAYKDASCDRQIGDRRSQNERECRLSPYGPSTRLPSAVDLTDIIVCAKTQRLVVSITDRRDFYHQIMATQEKAARNTIGPPIPLSALEGTQAKSAFVLSHSSKAYNRYKHGDLLHTPEADDSNLITPPDGHCWISFKSILQGDHSGVDIATDAHTHLLRSKNLLRPECTVTAERPLRSRNLCQGLVIDDYFCVATESADKNLSDSAAHECFNIAQKAYLQAGIGGSPHKDVAFASSGKVIGAQVNSSHEALTRRLITLGSPPEKRLSIAHICFQVAKLSHTTDCLHLCLVGGLVSILGFRRPLLSILQESFRLVDINSYDPNHPRVIPLSRAVACELTLVACLVPLMLTELSAPLHPDIFATDASCDMGAICVTTPPPHVAEALWKTCKSKGSYTRLLSPAEALLKRLDAFEEVSSQAFEVQEKVPRPLAYTFDFLEIYAGSAKVTKFMQALGVSTGPPIDISFSPELDLSKDYVMQWVSHLICNNLIKALMCEPPCTTFSIRRYPPLRSKACPYGFQPKEEKTLQGNQLAVRGCQMISLCHRYEISGLIEKPLTSLLQHMPAWKAIASLPNASQVRTDSCRFGSIHRKSFKFLGVHLCLDELALQCQCATKHVPVEGAYTKASAVYVDDLAAALASTLEKGIRRRNSLDRDLGLITTKGLENQLVNEVAKSCTWKEVKSWKFKKQSHINILEEAALLRQASWIARDGKSKRVVNLVDSNVVRCASAKGRSSSLGLSTILRRYCATCVGCGLYYTLPYCPTRLNVSDDPTRLRSVRSSSSSLSLEFWDRDDIFDLAAVPTLRRWASNWVRLLLLLKGPAILQWPDKGVYRRLHPPVAHGLFRQMDFDKTCGFPGEGPVVVCVGLSFFLSCLDFVPLRVPRPVHRPSSRSCFACSRAVGLLPMLLMLLMLRGASAMPMVPNTAGEVAKAKARAVQPPLPIGRPVMPITGSTRERYLEVFKNWAAELGYDLSLMLDNHYFYIDDLNVLLSRFGRELFAAGKTYNQYAETINSITSLRPALRRQMQGAWDLGYSWAKMEPSTHHTAMPGQVLLALLAVSLMWGWTFFAAGLALCWGALLRPGEFLAATRKELLLPTDVFSAVPYALLAIRDPKTRYTHSRHQTAKLDIPDLLELVCAVYGKLQSHQRLWPFSGQTMRQRLKSVMQSLSLPTDTMV